MREKRRELLRSLIFGGVGMAAGGVITAVYYNGLALPQAVEEMRRQVDDLKRKYEEVLNELKNAEADLELSEAERKKLSNQLEEITSELNESKQRIDELEELLNNIDEFNSEFSSALGEYLTDAAQSLEHMRSTIQKYRGEIDEKYMKLGNETINMLDKIYGLFPSISYIAYYPEDVVNDKVNTLRVEAALVDPFEAPSVKVELIPDPEWLPEEAYPAEEPKSVEISSEELESWGEGVYIAKTRFTEIKGGKYYIIRVTASRETE